MSETKREYVLDGVSGHDLGGVHRASSALVGFYRGGDLSVDELTPLRREPR